MIVSFVFIEVESNKKRISTKVKVSTKKPKGLWQWILHKKREDREEVRVLNVKVKKAKIQKNYQIKWRISKICILNQLMTVPKVNQMKVLWKSSKRGKRRVTKGGVNQKMERKLFYSRERKLNDLNSIFFHQNSLTVYLFYSKGVISKIF